MRIIEFTFLTALIGLTLSCSTQMHSTAVVPDKNAQITENNAGLQSNRQPGDTSQCDASLWDRVYNPTRLQVLDACKVVTGTIDDLDENPDGDTHMLLKLDAGYDDLLLKKNKTKKNGDLVVEVVCVHPVSDKKAVDACKGYSNKVAIPNVGDHVRVAGSYVNDSHNDWAEIHPASRIEKQSTPRDRRLGARLSSRDVRIARRSERVADPFVYRREV